MAPRVVLFQPQIPPNTGNVARTCAALGRELHLIEPLGFAITDRHLRRAGLDYWPWVDLHRHADLDAFERSRRPRGGRLLAFTAHATTSLWDHRFDNDDWLLFGREADGLPAELQQQADLRLRIPMPHGAATGLGGVRSLNLAVAVAVALFEAERQIQHPLTDA
ncbi:MAG: tRNA (cytidine(34)-2'-O)-methyltransferase [Cyanobacteriota bacterium]|jgi:tRNA (cytidine/uridine-2'-O-)-methyltransferase